MKETERKEKTLKGVRWTVLGQIVIQFINILFGIILTRLLTPTDFGLIVMVTVFTAFLGVFQDLGLGSYLIFKKNSTDEDYNTVFFTHLAIGLLLSLILFFSKELIISFYNEPKLGLIIEFIAVIFFIQSFANIQFTKLKKKIDFKSIFLADLISISVSSLIAIYLAWTSFGYWSLVYKIVLAVIIKTICVWIFSQWRPSFVFSIISLKSALKYSYPIIGNKTTNYFMRKTDNILIGRLLGSEALGIYGRAYSLMMFPVGQISLVLSKVLFSSFSYINEDLEKLKSNWRTVNRIISFLLFPLMIFIIILAEPFTMLILGPQWEEAIEIIQIFAVAGVVQGITNVGYMFDIIGKTKLNFKINLGVNLLLILSIIIGVQFGILHVAIAYTLTSLLTMPIIKWWFLGRELNITISSIFNDIKMYIIYSLFIGSILYWIISFFNFHYAIQLVFIPTTFILFYMLIIYLSNDKILLIIKDLKSNNRE